MTSKELLDNLIKTITPLCDTEEDIKAVPIYVKSDKYRQKMIDFVSASEEAGDHLTADNILLLALKMSQEEKAEGKSIKNKYTVISDLTVGKYKALELDRPITDISYTSFRIDGEVYKSVPIYDLPNNIAIESDKSFLGKEIECI